MTISPKRPSLSRPRKGEKIPPYNLAYARARNRNNANSFLLEVFRDSGLSKKEVAELLGKKPEQITRWLGGPGNVTLDTISDLVFAMQGNFVEISAKDELSKEKSNHSSPEWISVSSSIEETRVHAAATSQEWHLSTKNVSHSREKTANTNNLEVRYASGS